MTTRFETRKQNILAQLDTPEGDYHDLSPKGSVDEPIRELIDEINTLQGLVTTSSCSGRISVFLEGRKSGTEDARNDESSESRAGPGGKGGGGAWLFLSHAPVEGPTTHLPAKFGLDRLDSQIDEIPGVNSRYIHLKFEPMILHILTASTAYAQQTLTAALSAGFRESGAVSLSATKSGESTPIVAVRSTGYSFDSIIGYQDEHGRNIPLVDEKYLRTLLAIANDRFRINTERIARFRRALMDAFSQSALATGKSSKLEWEDADTRRQRKREEGLARRKALQANGEQASDAPQSNVVDGAGLDEIFG
ncbi:methyltransferase TYW3-domain-containing protein [Ampelomyces quisqualis]|uniref:tRNA(Phe) 7-[(3-amino-3-carboxypropyl)-4-demethylwyosine(37)-N(4)]-methyltransferase n=1 Tax=Ampelomyces quisqualis TaxID=50730 RepID=A0A6A5QMW2_AMPQU|nr:methyltransferase TYW3-domain-containing protein [Ampelomyces quisqualis]